MVDEESERVSFTVLREGGSQGRVTVMVTTVEGNIEDTGESVSLFSAIYGGGSKQRTIACVIFIVWHVTGFLIKIGENSNFSLPQQAAWQLLMVLTTLALVPRKWYLKMET